VEAAVILTADVGGTKIVFAAFNPAPSGLDLVHRGEVSSQDCTDFSALVSAFVHERQFKIDAIAIGLAGPVLGRQVRLTNLSWGIDADALAKEFSCQVFVMNDLVAHAYGVLYGGVKKQELRAGTPASDGNIAIIAAGTGLGQAIGVRIKGGDKNHYAVTPTEGGHTTFAPLVEADLDFSKFLFKKYQGHVSVERVVSGLDGFQNLLEFYLDKNPSRRSGQAASLLGSPDIGSQISAFAKTGDIDAEHVMNEFFKFYGAEAGNLCLKSMATGGLFICGGIAAKNASQLLKSKFFEAMSDKGRFSDMIARIPVQLVIDQDSAVKGAAAFVAKQLESLRDRNS